jgi:hypothetical protein
MRRTALLAIAVCTLVAAPPASSELPLGRPGLTETRSSQMLAAGAVHTRIVRRQV